MPKSEGYVSPKYLKTIAEFAREFKDASFQKMKLKAGNAVLDIGCGPAIDTIAMGKIVGPTGKVIGIDMDEEMIELANTEAAEASMRSYVHHQLGTAQELPFDPETFHAVRAERLFQVMPLSIERPPVFEGIKHTLKPDGIIYVTDTDWATATIDYPDTALERKLVHFFATQGRPDGFAGRRFFGQLKKVGFSDIQLETHVFTFHSLDKTPFGPFMVDMAVENGVITSEEGGVWINTLKAKETDGTFYSAVNTVSVTARK